MENRSTYRDYFSFESIRDHSGEVICYHVTMIGTIEKDGEARIRTDMGPDQNQKMAFGRITLHGCDRKIQTLLNETGSRVYYHSYTPETGNVDLISYTAKDWRADEVYNYQDGDRVLIEGRAYIRRNKVVNEDDVPEMSVSVTGQFMLGKRRRASYTAIVPQKD